MVVFRTKKKAYKGLIVTPTGSLSMFTELHIKTRKHTHRHRHTHTHTDVKWVRISQTKGKIGVRAGNFILL